MLTALMLLGVENQYHSSMTSGQKWKSEQIFYQSKLPKTKRAKILM